MPPIQNTLFRFFWSAQEGIGKLAGASLLLLLLISLWRVVRLCWRLRPQDAPDPKDLLETPDLGAKAMARAGLANRARQLRRQWEGLSAAWAAKTQRLHHALRAADGHFALWAEECGAEVSALRRTSAGIAVLALAVVAFGAANEVYGWRFGDNSTALERHYSLVVESGQRLGFGLLWSLLPLLAAGTFERALRIRCARWRHFVSSALRQFEPREPDVTPSRPDSSQVP